MSTALSATALDVLTLERAGADRFTGRSVSIGDGRPVFGGQLIGQVVMAAAEQYPDRVVRTVQVTFPRTGDPAAPLELGVEPVHVGRTMGTVAVAVTQGTRQVCRAVVLLDRDEPDAMRHGTGLRDIGGPGAATPAPQLVEDGAEVRISGGVDLAELGANGPAELLVWVRWPAAPRGARARNQAIGAWYTASLMIGAAMRPHDGVGGDLAHESLSTGVVAHTMTFHEPFDAADWHLITNESTYAGRGRVHGHGTVHTEDGRLVASFVQDAFVRHFPGHVASRGGSTGVM
jgi:acyl-CoA thioesterase